MEDYYDDTEMDSKGIDSETILKVVFELLICIFGLFGNFIVIFIIVVLKEYRKSVTHWYVLQLALADSLFLLTLPFKVSELLNKQWIYSNSGCKAVQTILFVNYYASILFLMIMSIDRYIAVCHSFSDTLQRLRKRSTSYLAIVPSIWIIAILLCIPIMLYSQKRGEAPICNCEYEFPEEKNSTAECIKEGFVTPEKIEYCLKVLYTDDDINPDEPYCTVLSGVNDNNDVDYGENNTVYPGYYYYDNDVNSTYDGSSIPSENGKTIHSSCHYWFGPKSWIHFIIYNFIAMFILPVLVMMICYGLIVRKLSSSLIRPAQTMSTSSFIPSNSGSGSKKRRKSSSRSEKDRRRVTIMCSALVSSFIICWLPFHSIHLAKIVGIQSEDGKLCTTLSTVGSLLAFLNSALNPYLYSFFGYNFVRRWKNATFKVRSTMRRQSSSSVFGSTRQPHRNNREASTSNNATIMTKTCRKPTDEKKANQLGTRHSFDAYEQSRSSIEPRHHRVITTVPDDVITAETPPPEYECYSP